MLAKLFEAFNNLNRNLDNPLREISVKQSQMLFSFEQPDFVTKKTIDYFDNLSDELLVSDIGCFNNIIYLAYRDLNADIINKNGINVNIATLYSFINLLKGLLCTCPVLEYVVSEDYIKVYLDVPNLQVSSLEGVNEALQTDGFLEFNGERPYILYVKDFADGV